MNASSRVQILWLLLFLVAGCSGSRDLKVSPPPAPAAPQTKVEAAPPAAQSPGGELFVLLPEADGKAGSIRVATAAGVQVLDRPGEATRVEDGSRPPTPRQSLDGKEMAGIFREALAAQPEESPRFVSFTLWFENDTSKLAEISRYTLPEILKTIRTRKPSEIHITGHTDRVGTDLHNLKLSSKRANFVKASLIARGIQSSVLFVSCLGESRPLVYTEDEVAEPLNRRVEVMIR
jgi:outer membrane protein OmpA-like peptidoglycan-associated protein